MSKSDEEIYDDLTHEMQNKLYAAYLKRMRRHKIFNLLGIVLLLASLAFILHQCGVI